MDFPLRNAFIGDLLERSREDTHYIIVLRDSWESLTLLGMEVSLLRNNAKVTNICTWRKPWELDLNGATKKWIHVCNLQWVQYMGFSMKQCKYKTMEVIMLHSINSNIVYSHLRWRYIECWCQMAYSFHAEGNTRNQLNFQDELAKRMDSVESHVTSMVITTFNDILSNTTCLSCPEISRKAVGRYI